MELSYAPDTEIRAYPEDEKPKLDGTSDEFGTPDEIFIPLDLEFQFSFDAAASAENYMLPNYFTKEDDALKIDWVGHARSHEVPPVFWCNPPYSRGNVPAFVRKAFEESKKGATVVMLLPARTEQDWFHDIVLKYAEVRFIRKRVKFIGGESSARFPSMVVIFRPPKPSVRLNNYGPQFEPRCVA